MAGYNIRARHGRMPYDVGEGRTRRLVRNPFQPQPILFVDGGYTVGSYDFGNFVDTSKLQNQVNENVYPLQAPDTGLAEGNKPSSDNIMSAAGSVLGGISAIADQTRQLSEIADTSGIQSDIDELANSDYTGASDNQSLLSQWGSTNWQKNDYTKSDVRGMTNGQKAGSVLNAGLSGMMSFGSAGSGVGGMVGAGIGAGVGLIGGTVASLIGMGAGNRKAKREAARLNVEATQANRDATNSFTQANNQLAQTTFNNQMANLSAEGGPLQRRKWAELPMRERSDLMRIYIRNGVKNLDEMKNHYDNVYARGGRKYDGDDDTSDAVNDYLNGDGSWLIDYLNDKPFKSYSNQYPITSPYLGTINAGTEYTYDEVPQTMLQPPQRQFYTDNVTNNAQSVINQLQLNNNQIAADRAMDLNDEYNEYVKRVSSYYDPAVRRPADYETWLKQRNEVYQTGEWYGDKVMNPVDPQLYINNGLSLIEPAGIVAQDTREDSRSNFQKFWDSLLEQAQAEYEYTGNRSRLDEVQNRYMWALNDRAQQQVMTHMGGPGKVGEFMTYLMPGYGQMMMGYRAVEAANADDNPNMSRAANVLFKTFNTGMWAAGALSPVLEYLEPLVGMRNSWYIASRPAIDEAKSLYFNNVDEFANLPSKARSTATTELYDDILQSVKEVRYAEEMLSGERPLRIGENAGDAAPSSDGIFSQGERQMIREAARDGKTLAIDRNRVSAIMNEMKGINDPKNIPFTERWNMAEEQSGFAGSQRYDFDDYYLMDNPDELALYQNDKIADIIFNKTGYEQDLSKQTETAGKTLQEVFGKSRFQTMERVLDKKRPDLSSEQRQSFYNELQKITGKHPTETANRQKAVFNWFINDSVRLPEDSDKINDAIEIAQKKKLNLSDYPGPTTIIDQYPRTKPIAKPEYINPDSFPDVLTNKQELANGITIYDVQESKEGQKAIRELIDSHVGYDTNPWCLAARDKDTGDFHEKAWTLWSEHYNKYPKQVAFKDGKLTAFSANDRKNIIWWDLSDNEDNNIRGGIVKDDPGNIRVVGHSKLPGFGKVRSLESYNPQTGESNGVVYYSKGQIDQTGKFQMIDKNGELIHTEEKVKYKDGKLALNGEYITYGKDNESNRFIQNYSNYRYDPATDTSYKIGESYSKLPDGTMVRYEEFDDEGRNINNEITYYTNGQIKSIVHYDKPDHVSEETIYENDGTIYQKEIYTGNYIITDRYEYNLKNISNKNNDNNIELIGDNFWIGNDSTLDYSYINRSYNEDISIINVRDKRNNGNKLYEIEFDENNLENSKVKVNNVDIDKFDKTKLDDFINKILFINDHIADFAKNEEDYDKLLGSKDNLDIDKIYNAIDEFVNGNRIGNPRESDLLVNPDSELGGVSDIVPYVDEIDLPDLGNDLELGEDDSLFDPNNMYSSFVPLLTSQHNKGSYSRKIRPFTYGKQKLGSEKYKIPNVSKGYSTIKINKSSGKTTKFQKPNYNYDVSSYDKKFDEYEKILDIYGIKPFGSAVMRGVPHIKHDYDGYILQKDFESLRRNRNISVDNIGNGSFTVTGLLPDGIEVDVRPIQVTDEGYAYGPIADEILSQTSIDLFNKMTTRSTKYNPLPVTGATLLRSFDSQSKTILDSFLSDKDKHASRTIGYLVFADPKKVADALESLRNLLYSRNYNPFKPANFTNKEHNKKFLKRIGFPYDVSDQPKRVENIYKYYILTNDKSYRSVGDMAYMLYAPYYSGSAMGIGLNTAQMTPHNSVSNSKYRAYIPVPFNTRAIYPDKITEDLDRAVGNNYVVSKEDEKFLNTKSLFNGKFNIKKGMTGEEILQNSTDKLSHDNYNINSEYIDDIRKLWDLFDKLGIKGLSTGYDSGYLQYRSLQDNVTTNDKLRMIPDDYEFSDLVTADTYQNKISTAFSNSSKPELVNLLKGLFRTSGLILGIGLGTAACFFLANLVLDGIEKHKITVRDVGEETYQNIIDFIDMFKKEKKSTGDFES